MTTGQPERATQNRIVDLFHDELSYRNLGNWSHRRNNSNIEVGLLTAWLDKRGYSAAQIGRALDRLQAEASNANRSLYDNNKAVYSLLRYGVQVQAATGENSETVCMVDWHDATQNDFAIAEEVTLNGNYERRPDIVIYVNGIAVGVLELKNSRSDISIGIRQNLSNQQAEFNEWFFSTVQLVFAGNDSQGLKYGAIKTKEKYFLTWKEGEADNSRFKPCRYT